MVSLSPSAGAQSGWGVPAQPDSRVRIVNMYKKLRKYLFKAVTLCVLPNYTTALPGF